MVVNMNFQISTILANLNMKMSFKKGNDAQGETIYFKQFYSKKPRKNLNHSTMANESLSNQFQCITGGVLEIREFADTSFAQHEFLQWENGLSNSGEYGLFGLFNFRIGGKPKISIFKEADRVNHNRWALVVKVYEGDAFSQTFNTVMEKQSLLVLNCPFQHILIASLNEFNTNLMVIRKREL